MDIKMKDLNLREIKEVEEFLEKSEGIEFEKINRKQAYEWIERVLRRFEYLTSRKKHKTIIKRYINKMTGYSRKQITNLIAKFRDTGEVKREKYERHKFEKKYTKEDIRLLAKTTEKHSYPNGASVKQILTRMADVYGQEKFKRLSKISVSHIYNFRKTAVFRRAVTYYRGTKKSQAVSIGKRVKPQPMGKPGFIRVDSVEQGSTRAGGGVYHINTVDEETQFQVIGSVPALKKEYMVPLLLKIIKQYPFKIINFHADNGSEYINQYVAKLLNELWIELTKSRPRQTNDNALAETKNTVIRKWIGYGYIAKKHATDLNKFYFNCFNEYLNFHKPCAFPVEEVNENGKIKRKYPHECYKTPYEKFKRLPEAEKYLKEGVSFEKLEKVAQCRTDNDMAEKVQEARSKLFDKITAAA